MTPTMEELAHKLSGAQHFSKLNAKNGYWSILLDAESQLLTTFHSPFRRFCFRRMPFGLVMSLDVFMQRMDMILEKCPGTIGLIDDVIGKTKEEHDRNLHNLMRIAQIEGLCFNSEKCAMDNVMGTYPTIPQRHTRHLTDGLQAEHFLCMTSFFC